MTGFIIRILGNSLALYVAFLLVPGFVVKGGIKEYLLAGVLLGILNQLVRPVLKIVSLPIIILTLGLFILILDVILLWIVDYIFDFVIIESIWALVLSAIVISIVNIFISKTTKILT